MLDASTIAELVGGELRGSPSAEIERVAPLDTADARSLSFVGSAKYADQLRATAAAVVIVSPDLADLVPSGATAIVVGQPQTAFRRVLLELHPEEPVGAGTDPTARISASADVHESASVGPYAVIEDGVEIGPRCRIGPHVVIGRDSTLGEDVIVHAGATLYSDVTIGARAVIHSGARVGKPGFGFVWDEGGHRRVPQVGGCIVGADVEIGANSTIDRGALGDTVIGAGTKIDNLVHVGHNVQIGEHVIIIAQVGVSGSTRVGDGAILAGQAGISGHLEIGAGARVGAQAGVIGDIAAGETVSGYPARPHREALRAQASVFRLPEVMRRLRKIEELLDRMKD